MPPRCLNLRDATLSWWITEGTCHTSLVHAARLITRFRYGNSIGTPTEEGLLLDAETVLKHILSLDYIDATKIIVFGRSLGGAVAVSLADAVSEKVRNYMGA